jgi:hypothetical protein
MNDEKVNDAKISILLPTGGPLQKWKLFNNQLVGAYEINNNAESV